MAAITIQILEGQADNRNYTFTSSFCIGRDGACEIRISNDSSISRKHAELLCQEDGWWVKDLNSTNGTYVDEQKIDCVAIRRPTKVRLGTGATIVLLSPEGVQQAAAEPPVDSASVTQYMRRYFDASTDDNAGGHTMMIRRAFARVQAKQKWKYAKIIGAVTLLLLLTGAYAFYLHLETAKQKARAEAIFYAMKSLELDIAGISRLVADSQSQQGREVIQKYRGQRQAMEKNYEQFVRAMGFYSANLSEPERLIFRVARIFGECELTMPKEFSEEIQKYIKYWQSTGRYQKAVMTAQEKGYAKRIAQDMLDQDLPPQFFYLAMQESNFEAYTVGPKTYKGYAKGMWQFIPETAMKYGLQVGPLVDLGRPDPGDERHDFEKATRAAARYLKFIYSTDAQASGLLVMSSYNWGEERVVKLLRTMPANPKDRNFWQLLQNYRDKIPQETYDYVFYIVSAAVIGENPRLFGFNFDNPLAALERRTD
jgi:membrane-bound lytic murein transglycosylase D